MQDVTSQGPLSGTEGKAEGTQPSKGTTMKTDSYMKGERPPKPQPEPEGRAEPAKGTSEPKEAPKKAEAEESFLEDFDPSTLPDELKPAYSKLEKQFKSAYTKKAQVVAKDKAKIEAYDAFMANPQASLQQAASQYGLKVEPISGIKEKPERGEPLSDDWQPNTWGEVFNAFATKLMGQFEGKMKPFVENVYEITQKGIENQLSEIDSDWRMYESEMAETLRKHPTLAKDVAKLYRISVPEEVLKGKYTQAALKRFESKAKEGKIQSKSSVSQSSVPTNQKLSFNEAVEVAKRQLASK